MSVRLTETAIRKAISKTPQPMPSAENWRTRDAPAFAYASRPPERQAGSSAAATGRATPAASRLAASPRSAYPTPAAERVNCGHELWPARTRSRIGAKNARKLRQQKMATAHSARCWPSMTMSEALPSAVGRIAASGSIACSHQAPQRMHKARRAASPFHGYRCDGCRQSRFVMLPAVPRSFVRNRCTGLAGPGTRAA